MAWEDVRGLIRGGFTRNAQAPVEINEAHEQLTAQGNLPYTESTRQANGWTVITASALTPLVGVPTTAAAIELFNNQPGTVLEIADLFGFQLLGTAVPWAFGLWAMVTTQKAVPTLTALDLASMSGKNKITPTAASAIVTGVGTTVVANGWRPFGAPVAWGTAAATPGASWSAPVDGKLLVPYQCSLCINLAGSVATASSFHIGASFYVKNATVATI